jgi:hypothetical protein
MIEVIFFFGTEIVMVRIRGNHVTFVNSAFGSMEATLEGLKLSRSGVIKEFPDLKDNPNWNIEAIGRFKEKINDMNNEEKIADYVIEDLRKFGYIPKFKQKAGFRREAIR